jgi:hypothetical protein
LVPGTKAVCPALPAFKEMPEFARKKPKAKLTEKFPERETQDYQTLIA